MEILFTEQFEQAYEELTKVEKRSVRKAIALLGDNPRYPSLRVKKMQSTQNIWEARPSRRLRMTFEMRGDAIILRNVGEHDKTLKIEYGLKNGMPITGIRAPKWLARDPDILFRVTVATRKAKDQQRVEAYAKKVAKQERREMIEERMKSVDR